jgi:hypothetical protein
MDQPRRPHSLTQVTSASLGAHGPAFAALTLGVALVPVFSPSCPPCPSLPSPRGLR